MNYIAVTGGAGFIGANLVLKLKEIGKTDIVVVDHIFPSNKKNLSLLENVKYFDKDEFINIVQQNKLPQISTIIHLGARTDTAETDENFLKKNNTEYSKILYTYSVKNKIPFIYASSASTYGDGKLGYDDSTRNLNPLNAYGKSKYVFDEWVLNSAEKPPQWAGLKFFNVFGPYESHKGQMASVAYHGFNEIKEYGKINLFKSYKKEFRNGEQKRDFIYIKDVVDIILFFLDHPNLSGIYNVGTGQARTFYDLATSLFSALNKTPVIKFIDMPEELKEKYQYFTEAKIAKLRSAGYKQKFYPIEHAVADYVKNFLLKAF